MRALIAILLMLAGIAQAQGIAPRDGWVVTATDKPFDRLVEDVRAAIADAPIALVTQVSASDGAAMQDIEIPGNRVLGVFRNDYALRMLDASVAAGIEAPLRLYLTEDGTGSTLSYETASFAFAPYMDEGGEDLADLAAELDAILEAIAQSAAE